MGMGIEAGTRRNDVVIADQEQSMVRIGRIVVARETEAMSGFEPASVGGETGIGAANINGRLE
jgi:hypothetical protein